MAEASIDEINASYSKLAGESQLVILLNTANGIKGVSKKLASLQDVKRIMRGTFIIPEVTEVHNDILQFQSTAAFMKTREIPNISKKTEDIYSELVYSIVAFRFKNPTAQQKKYVERMIKRTTGVRLRPGVVIFPILKSKQQRKIIGTEEDRVLLTSSEFFRKLRKKGADVYRWSRLRTTTAESSAHIKEAIEHTLQRDLTTLEERIRKLRERCKETDVEVAKLKKAYSVLSRRFRELKGKWMVAKKIWYYDGEKPLKRTYNMLISTRRIISAL
jgi:hypothetical protein